MSRLIVKGRETYQIKEDEEKAKKEASTKKPEAPKQKVYFDVKVDCMVPAVLTYRIYAFDEREAVDLINKSVPTGVKPVLGLKRLIKATVYKAGTSLMVFAKQFKV